MNLRLHEKMLTLFDQFDNLIGDSRYDQEKKYPIEYNQIVKSIKKIIEKEAELSIKFNNKSLTPTNIPPLGQKERNEVKIK